MSLLFIATQNKGKIIEFQRMFSQSLPEVEVVGPDRFPELAEPEETGSTFLENARLKSLYYAGHTGLPSLADDSGLVIDALGDRPGVQSARYAPDEAARINRVLTELEGVPDNMRTARFACAIVLSDPSGIVAEAEGSVEGKILDAPRGTMGFGYDPIFEVLEMKGRTMAELQPDEKNRISHRGRALQTILPRITEYFIKPR